MEGKNSYLIQSLFLFLIYLHFGEGIAIYSQIFGGITEQLTEEIIIQTLTKQVDTIPLIGNSEYQSNELAKSSESRVLHDFMYSRLEEKLSDSIKNVSNIPSSKNATNELSNNYLIRIDGRAEIEDYEKIRETLMRFNEFTQIIAYANKSSDPEHKAKILDITEKLSLPSSKDNDHRNLNKQLEQLQNPTSVAKNLGLVQDQHLLNNLAKLIEFINPKGFDILMHPQTPNIYYRGAIDRNWLRISPKILSNLYGGQSEIPWVMVGIVTNIQGTYQKQDKNNIKTSNPDNPMMLDAYRNMFRTSRFLERMFLESNGDDIEIVLSPLAIYRNLFEVKDSKAE